MVETTQICLDQKTTAQSLPRFFQKYKETPYLNVNYEDNEWEAFNIQEKELKFLKNMSQNIEIEKKQNLNELEISLENESTSEGDIIPQTSYFNEKEYSINHFMIWEHYYKKKEFEEQGINLQFEKNAIAMTNYIKLCVYLSKNSEIPNFIIKEYSFASSKSKKKKKKLNFEMKIDIISIVGHADLKVKKIFCFYLKQINKMKQPQIMSIQIKIMY